MSIFSVSFCARENRNKNCIFAFDYTITNTKSDQEISKKEEEETSSFYVIFLCFKPTESNKKLKNIMYLIQKTKK